MTTLPVPPETHQVSNQPPPLAGFNACSQDPLLSGLIPRSDAPWIAGQAAELGALVGAEAMQQLASDANRHVPQLRTHDRFGHRIDQVDYHPAYHELMQAGMSRGVHALAWTAQRPGAFTARAVLFYLWNQLEQGTACPMTMTFAGIQVLRHAPDLARDWEPRILAHAYDARLLPAGQKQGATVGMAMTEKQGGSDLRAVQTVAQPLADGNFALTGHKWFCSAPMSDAFFTLAREGPGEGRGEGTGTGAGSGSGPGVTCYFVPRVLPDGSRNRFLIQRLKEKVGNRSNASAEIEYSQTLASRVGEPGRGIATLIEMAHLTRFDIVVGTAGMLRAALHQVLHHLQHRSAFGKTLGAHALMQNVAADLALESEAATLLAFRLARAFDRAATDAHERAVMRILTPLAKYWLCKRITPYMVEAMECFGGNGYVDEHPLARLYREAPLNGIWEGSGNVICLDVLRSMQKSPEAVQALLDELSRSGDGRIAASVANIRQALQATDTIEVQARSVVEGLAVAMQAALLCDQSDPAHAEAFLASRLGGAGRQAFGTLPAATPFSRILQASALTLR